MLTPAGSPHQPSCRRPATRQGRGPRYGWAPARTHRPIAPARRLSSATRSAPRAALRVTEHRRRRSRTRTSGRSEDSPTSINQQQGARALDTGAPAQIWTNGSGARRELPDARFALTLRQPALLAGAVVRASVARVAPPAPLGGHRSGSSGGHHPRTATVRGHGTADMLDRNPRGEDTRWQSG